MASSSQQLPPLSILYGSATGNSEHIAKKLAERCSASPPSSCPPFYSTVICGPLDDYKKKHKHWDKDPGSVSHNPVLIVCATTGNADPPENAGRFCRYIKRKNTIESKPLTKVSYSVLALGDTNYDVFCATGKFIDKKMGECGGTRAMKLALADEATGLEDDVEPWLQHVVETMGRFVLGITEKKENNDEKSAGSATTMEEKKDESDVAVEVATESVTPILKEDPISAPPSSSGVALALSLMTEYRALHETGTSSSGIPSVDDALLPTLVACTSTTDLLTDRVPAELRAFADSEAVATATVTSSTSSACQYNHARPFCSSIVEARYLTQTSVDGLEGISTSVADSLPVPESAAKKDGEEKCRIEPLDPILAIEAESALSTVHSLVDPIKSRRVLEVTLSLPEDMEAAVRPGDAVGILVPNHPACVQTILDMLCAAGTTLPDSHVVLEGETLVLREVVAGRIDASHCAVRQKRVLATFAANATCDVQQNVLRLLASKCAAGEYLHKHLICGQSWDVGDLLRHFPSVKLDLRILMGALPAAVPRYYSVSSSTAVHPGKFKIAASVVDFAVNGMRRRGLATGHLEVLALPLLTGVRSALGPTVRIFPRRDASAGTEFHLPHDACKNNLIFIGPGTGVAPFIGFLEHMRAENLEESRRLTAGMSQAAEGTWRGGLELEGRAAQSSAVVPVPVARGSVDLFFGCRHRDHDWIYRKEMEDALADGTLTRLHTAFSREDSSNKVYVQHLMEAEGKRLASLLTDGGVYVYICGDGNGMARDVQDCILRVLRTNSDMTGEGQAEDFLKGMKERGRLLLDIWS